MDRIRAALPQLKAAIPHSIDLNVTQDQTVTIRASVRDVERTLIISVLLVILVVFVFLRSVRTTLIPSVAVPVSLIGTFGVMYLCGYSLDNLSLMALTISTGFVVDDAIVVIENITRYLEQGMKPFAAALQRRAGDRLHRAHHQHVAGCRIHSAADDGRHRRPAVPRIRGDAVGGHRDFDGGFAHHHAHDVRASAARSTNRTAGCTGPASACSTGSSSLYGRTLARVLRHPAITLVVLAATIALNVYLFIHVPKGFFPQQDNGRLNGTILADQDTSFQAMQGILLQMVKIVQADPAVDTVTAIHRRQRRRRKHHQPARMQIQLKPLAERKVSVYDVIERLRPKLSVIRGATLYLQAAQDVRVGGRNSASLYQFTMRGDNVQDLTTLWPRPCSTALRHVRLITDVNTDQQNSGLQAMVTLRSRHRGALRDLVAADRQRAVRRVRPAPGVHHVHGAQSVSRGDGSGAALLAGSGVSEADLRRIARRAGRCR